jgi:hypothetical protein
MQRSGKVGEGSMEVPQTKMQRKARQSKAKQGKDRQGKAKRELRAIIVNLPEGEEGGVRKTGCRAVTQCVPAKGVRIRVHATVSANHHIHHLARETVD